MEKLAIGFVRSAPYFESSLIVSNKRIRHPIYDLDHLDFTKMDAEKTAERGRATFPILDWA